MKHKKRDFLSRRPIFAQILVSDRDDHLNGVINERLPEGYIRSGRTFQFPAGYQESYLINGKDYNFQGDRSVEEQRALIETDLLTEGFSKAETDEFLQEIETEISTVPTYLSLDTSRKWLQANPHFAQDALQLLGEIKNEIQHESRSEIKMNRK